MLESSWNNSLFNNFRFSNRLLSLLAEIAGTNCFPWSKKWDHSFLCWIHYTKWKDLEDLYLEMCPQLWSNLLSQESLYNCVSFHQTASWFKSIDLNGLKPCRFLYWYSCPNFCSYFLLLFNLVKGKLTNFMTKTTWSSGRFTGCDQLSWAQNSKEIFTNWKTMWNGMQNKPNILPTF